MTSHRQSFSTLAIDVFPIKATPKMKPSIWPYLNKYIYIYEKNLLKL